MSTKTKSPRPTSRSKTEFPSRRDGTLASLAEVPQADTSMTKKEALDALKTANKLIRSVAGAPAARALKATAPSTDFASELNNIDFQKMIGGPLQACVSAQVASSVASVDFINSVGFAPTTTGTGKELVMVDFTHDKTDVDAAGATTTSVQHIKLPLIAMLQIPSLRIEYVEIVFNVKLNSIETQTSSSNIGVNAAVSGGWGRVKFNVSASYQRSTATGIKVEKEYALNVKVRAVQDEMPAGLERIMGMLAA